ncbi:cell wall-associated NlpC family hydrolase [Neobacillus niacini]|uniref:NlpC/P60 family protein n=1 Tax=Neobacillus niacini TaxID=86668 RepID=UPI00278278F2|nr:NlpC/P60 family protein [Neobacillus niacini]MDQ1005374.1 cell wall-associated NlpC family hydrolase [Neobacillus niacini]
MLEYAFAQVGINLYGTAQAQYNKTKPDPEDQIKPGDLVFPYLEKKRISLISALW